MMHMEFRLKDNWFDYLMSGFFSGVFFALIVVGYAFKDVAMPFSYLIATFGAFVLFIVTFIGASFRSKNKFSSSEYRQGYADAESGIKFSIPCVVCGSPVLVGNKSPVYEQVKKHLSDLGIQHKTCLGSAATPKLSAQQAIDMALAYVKTQSKGNGNVADPICSKCSARVPSSSKFCNSCGSPIAPSPK